MGQVAAGSLNKRVTFQRKVATQNEWGQPLESWVDFCTVWANIKTKSGSSFANAEQQAGGTEISLTSTSIRIRKRDGIDAAMRVLYSARIYDIRAVLPDDEGDEFLDVAVAIGGSEG